MKWIVKKKKKRYLFRQLSCYPSYPIQGGCRGATMICRKVPLHSGNGKGEFTADCFKDTKLLFVDTMPKVVDSFAQITKLTPSIRMVVWLLYQYKPNLSSLLYT